MVNPEFSTLVVKQIEHFAQCELGTCRETAQMAMAQLRATLSHAPDTSARIVDLAQLYATFIGQSASGAAGTTLDQVRAVLSDGVSRSATSLLDQLTVQPEAAEAPKPTEKPRALYLADLLDWGSPDALARKAASELRRLHEVEKGGGGNSPAFFYRIDGLGLTPGNKRAGFVLAVETGALQKLVRSKIGRAWQQKIIQHAQERLLACGLVSKTMSRQCGITFWEDSACPRYFSGIPCFGGSIGADPEELSQLASPEHDPRSSLEWLPQEICYTPHNMDTPKEAFVIMMLAQAWAEFACDHLMSTTRSI